MIHDTGILDNLTPLHKSIISVVTRPMTNRDIRLALAKLGVEAKTETLNYQLHALVRRGHLSRTEGSGHMKVQPPAPKSVPKYNLAFTPLRSIPRVCSIRTGGWNAELAPSSFKLGEQI